MCLGFTQFKFKFNWSTNNQETTVKEVMGGILWGKDNQWLYKRTDSEGGATNRPQLGRSLESAGGTSNRPWLGRSPESAEE